MSDQELIAQVKDCLNRQATMSGSKMEDGLRACLREIDRLKRQQKPLATGLPKLSTKQQRVYRYIDDYIAEHGYAPTVRDIAAGLGYGSTSTPHGLVEKLEKAGYVKRTKRGVMIVGRLEEAE